MTEHEPPSQTPLDEEQRLQRLDAIRGMELLPDDIRAALPPLYSGEEQGIHSLAQIKYFTPDENWTWYASEGSYIDEEGDFDTDNPKVDFLFFGLVVGFEIELGYFSFNELRGLQGPLGLPIERDLYFEPQSLIDLRAMHEKQRGE